jgi:single-stranded-DNA-specific exonuclease
VSVFREAFDAAVQDKMLLKDEVEELIIDVEIGLADLFLAGESVHEVPRIYKMLAEMEPFGPDNPKPVFVVRSVYAASYRILKEAHLKVALYDPVTKVTLPAIGFNLAEKADLVAAGCAFDCAFTLETNTWNNQTTLQLQIRDIREGS